MTMLFRHMYALLWKNWIIKKRAPFSSLMEIVLPLIVAILMVAIRSAVSRNHSDQSLHLDNALDFNRTVLAYQLGRLCGVPLNASNSNSNANVAPYRIGFAPRHTILPVVEAFNQTYPMLQSLPLVFDDDDAIMNYFNDPKYGNGDSMYPSLWLSLTLNSGSPQDPSTWSYTIRGNNTDDWQVTMPDTTGTLVETIHNVYDFGDWNTEATKGALLLQDFIENWMIQQTVGPSVSLSRSFTAVPFPTPKSTKDPFADNIVQFIGLLFTIVYLWPLSRIVKALVEEKSTRIKVGMKIMGASEAAIYLTWFITYVLIFGIIALLMMLIMSGSVFSNSNQGLIFIFFWVFGIAVFSFGFFMASFFSNPKAATLVSALVFFVIFFPYLTVSSASHSQGAKAASSLSLPIALSHGLTVIANWEGAEIGIHNDNASTNVGNFSYALALGMFIIDFVILTVAGLYTSRVMPSEWGTQLPLYFPFLPSFWCPKKIDSSFIDSKPLLVNQERQSEGVEPVSDAVRSQLSVSVKNLRKEFKAHDGAQPQVAVDNLSLDMYKGQILALLGHNGAGKTTTINMLSGMLPATSGDATVFGLSINTDMQSIRQTLGFCPQHNILWKTLTVREHLEFFALLKGVEHSAVKQVVEEAIQQVGLTEKKDTRSGALSGGMQRKLSVAIALLGDSKVVFLDEPTSGMDPYSRRSTWDLLKQKKEGRVIILTTHFMDEADQLGDRIAIMSHGSLRCCGSSLFLKSRYGVGYTLTVSKHLGVNDDGNLKFNEEALRGLIEAHVPSSEPLSNVAGEISFRLPFASSSNLPNLFEQFDSNKDKLGIESYGVSVTTLEEVFLRVGAEAAGAEEEAAERGNSIDRRTFTFDNHSEEKQQDDFADGTKSNTEMAQIGAKSGRDSVKAKDFHSIPIKPLERTPSTLSMHIDMEKDMDSVHIFLRHFRALFIKRLTNAMRDRKLWCWTFLIPVVLVAVGLGIIMSQTLDFPSIQISNLSYFNLPYPVLFSSPSSASYIQPFSNTNTPFVKFYPITNVSNPLNMSNFLFDTRSSNSFSRYAAYINDFQYINNSLVDNSYIYFNTTALFGLPINFNLYSTLTLRVLTSNPNAMITANMQPFPATDNQKHLFNSFISVFIGIGFAFIPASFIAYVVWEESKKVKHQQLISGVSTTAYWLSSYTWDFLNFLTSALLCYGIIAAVGVKELIGENSGAVIVQIILYGLSVIPFSYCMSFLFSNHSSAQMSALGLFVISGSLLVVAAILLQIFPSTRDAATSIKFVFRLFPSYCFGESIAALVTRTSITATFGSPRGIWDMDVVGYNSIFMAWEAVVCMIIVLVVEYVRATPALLSKFDVTANPPLRVFDDEDSDVIAEKQRLQSMPPPSVSDFSKQRDVDDSSSSAAAANGLAKPKEMISIRGLRKVYGSRMGDEPKIAVHDLWLSIQTGSCYGYLGINGAGKTTTLKMLSGDILSTAGTAYLSGLDIRNEQVAIRRLIGYCPQFDALIDNMTAREHLCLFARIKGVVESEIPSYVSRLISKLGFQSGICDKPCGGYSGGNKRKLCVGIALIGNPPILFLDEPSTGMDPMSRRSMWDLLSSTKSGRSVILTTHSMEECEALCDNIGIMVGGRLRCTGTTQHLKTKFGDAYQVDVHVSQGPNQDQFVNHLMSYYKGSKLIEKHGDNLKFRILKQYLDVAENEDNEGKDNIRTIASVFRWMEQKKQDFGISEYSVSEMTLEQIFLHFAKQQEEETGQVAGIMSD